MYFILKKYDKYVPGTFVGCIYISFLLSSSHEKSEICKFEGQRLTAIVKQNMFVSCLKGAENFTLMHEQFF